MSADIETDFEAWARLLSELEVLPDEASRSRLLAQLGVAERWPAVDALWRAQLHQDRRVGEARRAQRLEQLRQHARQRAQRASPPASPARPRSALEPNAELAATAPASAEQAVRPALPFAGRRATPMPARSLEPNPDMGATLPLRSAPTPPPPVAPPPVMAVAVPVPPPLAPPPAAPGRLPEPPAKVWKPPPPVEKPAPAKPPDPAPAQVQLDPDSARVAASLKAAGASPGAVEALIKAMSPAKSK